MSAAPTLRRFTLLALALVFPALGIVGLVRGERGGWGGFTYSPEQVMDWVEPGSAADAAGLRAGDTVLTVDGRPASDLPMQSRWAATRPGESHTLTVRRAGQVISAEVVYRQRGPNPFAQGAFIFFVAFLYSGIWALVAAPTAAGRALGSAGLAAGVAMAATLEPAGWWTGVFSHVQMLGMVAVGLFLLRFFLTFPEPKRIAASRVATGAMWLAWLLLVALCVVEILVHPRLYRVVGNIGGLVDLGYVVLGIVALVHSVAKAPRGTLWRSGLGWALIAMGLAIVSIVTPLVGGAVRLPGAQLTELLFVLVPIGLALAVRQSLSRDHSR